MGRTAHVYVTAWSMRSNGYVPCRHAPLLLFLCGLLLLLPSSSAATAAAAASASAARSAGLHTRWSGRQVSLWLRSRGFDASTVERFEANHIDGTGIDELSDAQLAALMPDTAVRQRWREQRGQLHEQSECNYTGLAQVSRAELLHLRKLAQRYPLVKEESAVAAEAQRHSSSIGVGPDGCARLLSRLFTRPSDEPRAWRRKLFVLVGDDPAAIDHLIRTYPYIDFLVADTRARVNRAQPMTNGQPMSASDKKLAAAQSEPIQEPLHGRIGIDHLNYLPCLLAALGVQPHVVFIADHNHLQTLTNVWHGQQLAKPMKGVHQCSCDANWDLIFPNPPQLMGTHPPLHTHDGYLSTLARHLFRRIYVDSGCFAVARSEMGAGCLDALGDTPAPAAAPLLTLYMMVKDEAAHLRETLDSALPHVDRVALMDTGSTDETIAVWRDALSKWEQKGQRGALLQEPFIDFSTSRNRAMQHAAVSFPDSIFMLMLNGDDELRGGPALRRFLVSRRNLCGPSEEMYLVAVDYNGLRTGWSERLLRTAAALPPSSAQSAARWHYRGLTHEQLTHAAYAKSSVTMSHVGHPHPVTGALVGGGRFGVVHHYRETDAHKRWRSELDVTLLQRQLAADSTDMRAIYYLARSFDQLARYEEAYAHFNKRVAGVLKRAEKASPSLSLATTLNSASDERKIPSAASVAADTEECYALLRMFKIGARGGGGGSSNRRGLVQLARVAIALCPRQCEIPFYLAEYYAKNSENELARLYLEHAARVSARHPAMMEAAVSKLLIGELGRRLQQYREEL